tara:strand:- start:82 stop:381 length:300 start_codon:yes stop_codon:yes gene_type:complete
MRVRLAPSALEDLESIDDYTVETWGADQATMYLKLIWDRFEWIGKDPFRLRLRPEIHPDCRICFVGRHAILYRVRVEEVEIARVLHDASDILGQGRDAF